MERLPAIIDDLCLRVYTGIGPDVPFDLTFWTWYQRKKIMQNVKAYLRNYDAQKQPYDQVVSSFDFQAIFTIALIAK